MLNRTEQNTDSFHVEASSTAKVRCVPRTDLNDNLGFSASQVEHSPLTLFSNIRRALLTLKTSLSRKGRGSSPLSSQCTSLRTTVKQSKQRLLRSVSFMQAQKQTTRSDVKRVKPLQHKSLRAIGLMVLKTRGSAKQSKNVFSPFTFSFSPSRTFHRYAAFTLAEILIVIGIVGGIASLTIPNLIQSAQERQMVAGLQKFNSNLQQAVMLWKQDIGCDSSAYFCLLQQGLTDDACSNFNQIGKFMQINKQSDVPGGTNTFSWLPAQTKKYNGDDQEVGFGGVSQTGAWRCAYSLSDGMNMAIDPNATNFAIIVDVNGQKAPNRHGKDTFTFVIGGTAGTAKTDLKYYPGYGTANFDGLCKYANTCNPDNVNPMVGNGASPTAYVILHHELPDFKALSQTVSGFRP